MATMIIFLRSLSGGSFCGLCVCANGFVVFNFVYFLLILSIIINMHCVHLAL